MPIFQFPPGEKKHFLLESSLEMLARPIKTPKYSYSDKSELFKLEKLEKPHFRWKLLIGWILFIVTLFISFYGLKSHKINSENIIFYVKAGNPDFVGRGKYLECLYQELFSKHSSSNFAQSAHIKVLWGKGGFGKSEIAIEFANRYSQSFSLIWTFYCDTEEHLNHSYRQLAEKLNICSSQESPDKIRRSVNFYLENSPFEKPWLLIFDNLEKVIADFPQRGGAILITSQKKILGPEFIIEVQALMKEESLLLVEKITGEKRGPSMERLVESLEGIPLLISYAAHYIKATPGCTVDEYKNLLSANLFQRESPLWRELDVNRRYIKSLAASWEFPLKSLEKENLQALQWIFVCSYLHPEQIAEEWIDEWLCHTQAINSKELQPQQRVDIEVQRKNILSSLQNYGIVRYEQKTKTFSLHRFFQHFVRERRGENISVDLGEALNLIAQHSKDYDFTKFSSWQGGEQWILHASTIQAWLSSLNSDGLDKRNEILLYDGLGNWFFFHDRYQDALTSHFKSLNLREQFYPKSHFEIGVNYTFLARALFEIGRYPETVEVCEKAKKILIEYSEGKSVEYGNCLHILGRVFFQEGEYRKALEYHEQTLRIFSEKTDPEDFRVGTSLYNIALCRGQLGNNREAVQLFEEAMKIYYKTCGEQHPFFARALYGKAWALYKEKQYQKALATFHKALSIFISTQGDHSGYVAHCWNRIGRCLTELKKIKKAKKGFKKALKIGLFCYGEDSRSVLQSYHGLGVCYLEEMKLEKGLSYLSKELQIGAKMYPQACKKLMSILEKFKNFLEIAHARGAEEESIRKVASIAYQICEVRWDQTHPLTQFFLKKSIPSSSL